VPAGVTPVGIRARGLEFLLLWDEVCPITVPANDESLPTVTSHGYCRDVSAGEPNVKHNSDTYIHRKRGVWDSSVCGSPHAYEREEDST